MTMLHYDHICVVLDASGSMGPYEDDTIGNLEAFIKDQQKLKERKCTFSLYTFNNEVRKRTSFVNLQNIVFPKVGEVWGQKSEYIFFPSYKCELNTALRDAVGTAIDETGKTLSILKEEERPSTVIFVIQTDGIENWSKKYSAEQIREKVTLQKEVYNWQFIFMGSGGDTWLQAEKMGIVGINTMSVEYRQSDKENTKNTYSSISDSIIITRSKKH